MTAVVPIRAASTVIPSAIEAEQALIGAVLMVNASYDVASGIIGAEDFFDPFHAHVWRAIGTCIGEGRISSPLTIAAMCGHVTDIAGMTVREYLTRCVTEAMPVEWTANYARLVKDASVRRRLIVMAERLDADARNTAGAEPAKVLATALSELDEVRSALQAANANDRAHIATFAGQYVEKVQDRLSGRGGSTSLHCGLTLLDRQLGGFQRSGVTVIAGRPGMGKAQPLTAMVKTRDGWKAIGDLRLGDALASIDGAPSLVSGIFPQGTKPIFKITFSDGRSTRACADHLWSVSSCKFDGPRVLDTKTIAEMIGKERFTNRLYVPLISGHFGRAEPLPIAPWLLGALIGNGNMSGNCVRISTADAATLYRVQRELDGVSRLRASGDYDYAIVNETRGGENHVMASLSALGLMGKRSEEKFIPAAYMNADRASRLELLRGLMDTDGWVETFGVVRYSTSSKRLADDVVSLVRSVGGLCTVAMRRAPKFTHKGEKREGMDHYVCTIRHSDPKSLMSLVRKSRRCDRKVEPRLTIRAIEPDGEEQAVCISVTHPSRLYVTDDYVVTHNTAMACDLAYRLAEQGHAGAFFSIEMGADQMLPRFFSSILTRTGPRVEYSAIMRGDVSSDCLDRMIEAERRMKTLPLFLDTVSSPTVSEIQSRCRSATAQLGGPLDFIVVDYLGLVSASARYQGQRTQEVGEVSRGMKALAKTMGCAVILLAQLNRKNEDRGDKRPELSDLRDSGEIEQDAEAVLFPFREAYYLQSKTDHDSLMRYHDVERVLEIIVAKNRHGSTGSMRLYCDIGANLIDNMQG